MTRAKIVLLASAWALAAPARADFQLWSEAGASVELASGLRLGFDQQLRLDHGAGELDLVRPAAWISWRAAGWLSLRLGYRYEIEPHFTEGADYADGWHEGWVDATLRHEVRRVRLSLRLRLEEQRGRPWDADGALVRSHTARQRLEVAWPFWRKVALVGSGELFLAIADPEGVLEKWRGAVGLAVPLGDHEIAIRYLLEHPLTPGDEDAHVLGLSYRFSR